MENWGRNSWDQKEWAKVDMQNHMQKWLRLCWWMIASHPRSFPIVMLFCDFENMRRIPMDYHHFLTKQHFFGIDAPVSSVWLTLYEPWKATGSDLAWIIWTCPWVIFRITCSIDSKVCQGYQVYPTMNIYIHTYIIYIHIYYIYMLNKHETNESNC